VCARRGAPHSPIEALAVGFADAGNAFAAE
jgi:hypothetical protein